MRQSSEWHWSKYGQLGEQDKFFDQKKNKDVVQFSLYFPQKCGMRSSSIESNTTRYNRLILCKSREGLGEKVFFSFVDASISSVTTSTRDREMHVILFGWETNKQTNKQRSSTRATTWRFELESQRATNLSGIKNYSTQSRWVHF